MGDLSYADLIKATGDKLGNFNIPSPSCGPSHEARHTHKRPVMRVWRSKPDFVTYNCVRCGAQGFAKPDKATKPDPAKEEAEKKEAQEEAKREAERKANKQWHANNLWQQRRAAEGTLVETYLRETRGLQNLPPFDMLGFLPAGLDRIEPSYPAMICAYGLPDEYEPGRLRLDATTGVHLTFLDGARKAPIPKPKQMRGTCKGKPLVLAAPNDGNAICIAEGIETALTAHDLLGIGAWAAGSASFMPPLADAVPDYIECVWIEAEDDPDGQRFARELQGQPALTTISALIANCAMRFCSEAFVYRAGFLQRVTCPVTARARPARGHYTGDDVPPKPLARTTACAAASRAIGTRNGEQDT
ncbi:MAG: hypothetical protein WCF79_14465 [Rhodomicrobium sp.]